MRTIRLVPASVMIASLAAVGFLNVLSASDPIEWDIKIDNTPCTKGSTGAFEANWDGTSSCPQSAKFVSKGNSGYPEQTFTDGPYDVVAGEDQDFETSFLPFPPPAPTETYSRLYTESGVPPVETERIKKDVNLNCP